MHITEEVIKENNLWLSDRKLIQFKLNGRVNKNRSVIKVLHFKWAKFEKLRELISELSWTKELKGMNVRKAWDSFQAKV